MANGLDGLTVIVDRLGRIADEIAHRRARNRPGIEPLSGGRRPFVGVERRLIQHDARGLGRSRDDGERLSDAGRGVVGGCVERREQL